MKSKRSTAASRNKGRKTPPGSNEKRRGRPAKPFNFGSVYPDPEVKVSEDEDFGFIEKDVYLRSVKDDQELWEAALTIPWRAEKPAPAPLHRSLSPAQ